MASRVSLWQSAWPSPFSIINTCYSILIVVKISYWWQDVRVYSSTLRSKGDMKEFERFIDTPCFTTLDRRHF